MKYMARRKPKCPICGKAADETYQPFCSKRCSDLDLGRWLGGTYRIPTEEPPEEGDWPPLDEEEG